MQKKITANDFGTVVVLMGGSSSEREVSLESGEMVLQSLLRQNINACGIDVGENVIELLQTINPDRVFIALHGTSGEDGVIQSVLDALNIPYASSSPGASALTFDKQFCNLFIRRYGVATLPLRIINEKTDFSVVAADLGLPLCVKPVSSGSTCGVSKVTELEQFLEACMFARQYSPAVMVEPWIDGREFTVAILGDTALPVIEIVTPKGEFYDYAAKYKNNTTEFICPCKLPQDQMNNMQELALTAFRVTGCKYWGRLDFIQDSKGKFWCLDINTIPGMTSHSLMPKAALQRGLDYDKLVWKILELSYGESRK